MNQETSAPEVVQETEAEELGLSAAMVGLGQVASAGDGSVESTLVMESLGYESALVWPNVPGVFFPEPYAVDHPWSEGAPPITETADDLIEEVAPAQSGEYESSLSERDLASLEREPTYIDLNIDEDGAIIEIEELGDGHRPEMRMIQADSELDELDEDDIEEIEFIQPDDLDGVEDDPRAESRGGDETVKVGEIPPIPADARQGEAASSQAQTLPLDRETPLRSSGSLPEARSEQPDGWDALATAARRDDRPWPERVFDDLYVQSLPHDLDRQTAREVEFASRALRLKPGAAILDLACGFGRHSVALAERGYTMTGIDLSEGLLRRAQQRASRSGANVTFWLGDMRHMDVRGLFDGVVVLGSSFGYFDDRTNLEVLKRINGALRPGGRVLCEFLNRDRLINELPKVTWWRRDARLYLDESEFDFERSRLTNKRTVIFDDGSPFREQYYNIRLYSLHEVHALIAMAGFRAAQVSGSTIHPELFFPMNSRRLYVLAEKA